MSILNTKKLLAGGLIAMSMAFTGCLTDDTKDPPANTGTALTEVKQDTVWNLQGPTGKLGAYDLVVGAGVASAGPATSKDLLDQSSVGGAGVTFPKTWTSGNGTTFVMGSSVSYATATDSAAIKGFAAGTAVTATTVLAPGTVVLAKLRGTARIAVISIVAVNETSGDNLDNIVFKYKRTP